MISLLLSVLFGASFGLVVKKAQLRELRLFAVGAVNYIWAALFYAAWGFIEGVPEVRDDIVSTGIFGGLAYFFAYFFFISAIRVHGASIASAAGRLAQLLPVGYAMFAWGETMSGWQALGLLFFCMAAPVLLKSNQGLENSEHGFRAVLMLCFTFLMAGLCGVSTKRFDGVGLPHEKIVFLLVLFSTTSVLSFGLLFIYRLIPTREELLLGLILGQCNTFGNLFWLQALNELGGIILFPVASALSLVWVTFIATTFLEEKISRRGLAGIALAGIAVVLLSMAPD